MSKPLTKADVTFLRMLADEFELHQSGVQRVAKGQHVATPSVLRMIADKIEHRKDGDRDGTV